PRGDLQPLIWLHAVSVGETRAAQPLVDALLERYPQHELLITLMTPTGREAGAALFSHPRIHRAYLPYDYPFAVRRLLRAWRLSSGRLKQAELWRTLGAIAREEGVRVALVTGRLSERPLRKGQRWARLIEPALATLDLVLAQSADDASRRAQLGRD